jgi:hypothetical protein
MDKLKYCNHCQKYGGENKLVHDDICKCHGGPYIFKWDDGVVRQIPQELRKIPECPYCSQSMVAIKYTGYYDSFYYWECNCKELPEAIDRIGSYVY